MPRTYRLQVPIKPETRKALEEFADAMGITVPQAAAQFLEEAAPGIMEMAAAVRKVHQSPSRALKDMADMLGRHIEEADQLAMDLEPKPEGKRKRRKAS